MVGPASTLSSLLPLSNNTTLLHCLPAQYFFIVGSALACNRCAKLNSEEQQKNLSLMSEMQGGTSGSSNNVVVVVAAAQQHNNSSL